MSRRSIGLAGAVTTFALGLGAVQLLPGAAPEAQAQGLVGYDSCADLLEHYRKELQRSAPALGEGNAGTAVPASAGESRTAADSAFGGSGQAVGSGPSGTNVQEEGVDEPDIAKLRDGRLVVLNGTRLRILSAQPQPQVLGGLDLSRAASNSDGGELLLVGDEALVILPGWRHLPASSSESPAQTGWVPGSPTTSLVLVDIDGNQPTVLEESTYNAQYVSARLVDGTVRLVTTTTPQVPVQSPVTGAPSEQEFRLRNRAVARTVQLHDVLPQVVRRDPAGSVLEQGKAVSCDDTSYSPGSRGGSTLLVTTLRPEHDGLAATDREAVTTDGNLVYSSSNRLYIATSRWGTVVPQGMGLTRSTVSGGVRTQLHAFDTSGRTTTTYVGSGSVDGYVYGRWALSEHDGVLRVATTSADDQASSSSMIVKLAERNGQLVETNRVSGLGLTEHIKAVRYFGNLAAVVTFRQTDPLYLIDLGEKPRVLGELKIPGFSTYLHPLGDGLLMGVGHDATDRGEVTGMQFSVFDISDPTSPRQVDRLSVGNGWSPALDDSRAFTYDPQRRVAALAFTSWDPQGLKGEQSSALGVHVSDDGMLSKAGELDLAPEERASRVVFEGSTVFTISDSGVVAADTASWTRTGAVSFGHVGVPVPK